MLPNRVAAVIIINKKILLVTGYEGVFYWTPGGKIEGRESHENCLIRELFAELGIELESMKYYATFTFQNEIKGGIQTNHYYLVQFKGKIKPGQEITNIFWYSKQNFINKKPKISKGIETYLIPKLIDEGYL